MTRRRREPVRRGLVLGGGGVLGAAWQVGAMCALEEELGVSCVDMDVIVGTSAGSVVGCFLAAGVSPEEQYAYQRGVREGRLADVELDYTFGGVRPRPPSPRLGSPRLVASWLRERGRPGTAALLAGLLPRGRGSLGALVPAVERLLPDWPDVPDLRIVATDFSTGARHWFGGRDAKSALRGGAGPGRQDGAKAGSGGKAAPDPRDGAGPDPRDDGGRATVRAGAESGGARSGLDTVMDGVDVAEPSADTRGKGGPRKRLDLGDAGRAADQGLEATPAIAMAASCAMPSVFAPVAVNGRLFVDGGASSMASADLVAGLGLDEVYVLAPLAQLVRTPGPWSLGSFLLRQWRQPQTVGLLREIEVLKREGTTVTLLAPTAEDQAVLGLNPMAPERRLDVLETSRRTARSVLRSGGVRTDTVSRERR